MAHNSYIPALRFHWLTRLYDPVVRLTTREHEVKSALIATARAESARNILDLGCGTGTLTIMVKQAAPSARVIGLDMDQEALLLAESKAEQAGVEIELVHGDGTAPPFIREEFDLIVSSLLLHHLTTAQKIQALRECVRLLQPGGLMVIADWTKPDNRFSAAGFLLVRALDGFALTADNAQGRLPDLCRISGFEVVTEIQRIGTPIGTIGILQASV